MSENILDWNLNPQTDELTIKELEALCNDAFLLKAEIDILEQKVSEKKERLHLMQSQIDAYLSHYNKKSWSTPSGSVEVRERLSVKTPKDEDSKRALFKWLNDKGIFWQSVGVNSQTLNAMYNAEFEAAKEKGLDFNLPGVEPPAIYRTVVLKNKGKKHE